MAIQRGFIVKLKDGREGIVVAVYSTGVVEISAGGVVFSHVDCLTVVSAGGDATRSEASR